MFFQILGAITEFEHSLRSERTMDGLAGARGRTVGQKPRLGPRQVAIARQTYDETGPPANAATPSAKSPNGDGVSRLTVYRHLERQKNTPQ